MAEHINDFDVVLSATQAKALLQARGRGEDALQISPDLGLSKVMVRLEEKGVVFPNRMRVLWSELERILANPQACFRITSERASKIQAFSDQFGRAYSLMPTQTAPTLLISGITMHRIKGVDPMEDTRRKIRALAPFGRVLDTATGLGYTAIFAARKAEEVVTVELDPTVLEIARLNPWSRELFTRDNIIQLIGDCFDYALDFPDASFDRILHDPPRFSLAGHLYSTEFYRHLHRLLRPGGRLFHYVGDPSSKSGRNTTKSVARRLQEAGFRRVIRKPRAFGLLAFP
ncbi:MAG: methyltransferase domain-containing protein [Chloroflexi bacterium]|nr:methyltransferase domain-containing protein [Chloroflexota bacterium]